ncbi:MAG: response regulator transcription factor [Chloroflexota bacterium]|nr:response regulator transcription factor [Chloroflexota bacterium]
MLHPQRTVSGLSVQSAAHLEHFTRAASQPSDMDAYQLSRVLVVDDHSVFRRVLREVLDQHPQLCVVGEAANGAKAVSLAVELQPDIVVLDMELPDMNGVVVTQQLVRTLPGVRVVILSFATADSLIVDAIRAGAFGFLSKDIQPDALARALLGVAEGEVAMSRRTAARVMAHFRQGNGAPTEATVNLTDRELEVLRLLANGATDRQIADRLVIAESTAKKHVQHILRKLRARNRAEAVAKFREVQR